MLIIVLCAMAILLVGFAHYARGHARAVAQRTRRFYSVSAPGGDVPGLEVLKRGLERRGYRLEIASHGVQERAGARVMRALMSDTRHPDGRLHLCLEQRQDLLDGQIESEDSGPEFYEEMARYAILVLSESIPELSFASPGADLARADTLAAELPAEPLGMSLD